MTNNLFLLEDGNELLLEDSNNILLENQPVNKSRILKHNIINHIQLTSTMKHYIRDLIRINIILKHQILKLSGIFTRRFKHQIISHIRKSITLKHQIQLFRPLRRTRRIINLLKDRASIYNEGAYEQ